MKFLKNLFKLSVIATVYAGFYGSGNVVEAVKYSANSKKNVGFSSFVDKKRELKRNSYHGVVNNRFNNISSNISNNISNDNTYNNNVSNDMFDIDSIDSGYDASDEFSISVYSGYDASDEHSSSTENHYDGKSEFKKHNENVDNNTNNRLDQKNNNNFINNNNKNDVTEKLSDFYIKHERKVMEEDLYKTERHYFTVYVPVKKIERKMFSITQTGGCLDFVGLNSCLNFVVKDKNGHAMRFSNRHLIKDDKHKGYGYVSISGNLKDKYYNPLTNEQPFTVERDFKINYGEKFKVEVYDGYFKHRLDYYYLCARDIDRPAR